MKLKDIDRTANIAWSPAQQYPIYIAAGTAAQQLDATFSTNAALELYLFNPESKSQTCKNVCSAQVEHRFNKVVWGCQGMGQGGSEASGLIVGAMDNGLIYVWDAARLLQQQKYDGSRLHTLSKPLQQSGAGGASVVTSLDFNPFKPNLLASGGSESEILIWDMEKPSSPMAPGAKSQPLDEVTCLAWNRQVQHILASTLSSRCIVWDLRKNEPIIKISDSMSRIKSKTVVWHPEVATQMCLSSEDDHTPVIQLWDLRYAASPVKVLEKHDRGILSMAWCHQDPDLLLSCSKDNRVLCWNPNSSTQGGEVVYELPSNHWCFDVQWCPRNPQVISASSFEGHIGIYTLMGGEIVTTDVSQSHSKIADSFGAIDDVLHTSSKPKQERHVVPPIAKAPKWLKRPCGVSFGFGGKLVIFNDEKTAVGAVAAESGGDGQKHRKVLLSSVVTEEELLGRSAQLEQAVGTGQHREYCAMKAANSDTDSLDQQLWSFLKANFDGDASKSFLHLLGFDDSKLADQVKSLSLHSPVHSSTAPAAGRTADEDSEDQQLSLASESTSSNLLSSASHTSTSSTYSGGDSSIFDNIGQPPAAPARSASPAVSAALLIQCDTGSSVGLLTRALLTGNIQLAVDICLRDERMADAMILAASQGPELFERTMRQYFSRRHDVTSKLIASVVNRRYADIVRTCSLDSWKEALALVLTYAKPEELRPLCDVLGARLENELDGRFAAEAVLCYICSGNVSKFVEAWQAANGDSCAEPLALQDLVEKVTLLRHAVSYRYGQSNVGSSPALEHKLAEYGQLLASQGCLQVALAYLSTGSADDSKQRDQVTDLGVLCHRVARALGQQSGAPWRVQPLVPPRVTAAGQSRGTAAGAQPSSPGRPGATAAVQHQHPAYQPQPAAAAAAGHHAAPLQATLSGGGGQLHGGGGGRAPSASATGHTSYASQQQSPAYGAAAPSYGADTRQAHSHGAAAPAGQPSVGYYGGSLPGAGAALYGAQNFATPSAPHGGGGFSGSGTGPVYEQQPASLNPPMLGGGGYAQQTGAYWPGQQQPSIGQAQAGHVVTRGLLAQKYHQASAAPAPTAAAQQQLPSNVFNPAGSTSALGQPTAFSTLPGASDPYGGSGVLHAAAPTQLLSQQQQHVSGYATAESTGAALQEEVRYEGPKVPAGWNDPPVMSPSQSVRKKDVQAPTLNVPSGFAAGGGGMGDQSQAALLQPAGGQYYNPNDYQNQQQQQHAPPPSPKEFATQEPASHAKHPKAPIPSEHQVLCDVLNSIAYKCLDSADSAQTKRKLEMVLTELEVLYDKLREYQLSQSVLAGLHQIVKAVVASDYPGSLSIIAGVIAQGNFSEIGAFMPGIKMLVQTAQRLHVYL